MLKKYFVSLLLFVGILVFVLSCNPEESESDELSKMLGTWMLDTSIAYVYNEDDSLLLATNGLFADTTIELCGIIERDSSTSYYYFKGDSYYSRYKSEQSLNGDGNIKQKYVDIILEDSLIAEFSAKVYRQGNTLINESYEEYKNPITKAGIENVKYTKGMERYTLYEGELPPSHWPDSVENVFSRKMQSRLNSLLWMVSVF